ncbi:MerR family transcriptional regulator [Brevibacillus sp. 7WMA2]|uniref:Putative transcriptional regulator n=1 Tax=Brevibacillus laterosporus LMG 15441 TaxID=1042163 RepID=A0A075R3S9_BRELA|nr:MULTISPECIES: MerR family transcriptional regulator [Brevibacillus]MBA4534135.1 MerR family transcriptional regulator [Brevibacillus halotolerans]AIG26141.1 putative transcriptional regulator [Brevibacillus laterosporus LMG 15441]AUM64724.1 MerR family DNA-binding transcriptional regulator [Brevibacillus laterosporus]MDF9411621.1 MerR family transcriptional regulator [Brevibacillus laterosporus]PCN43812.1 MerR family transcriptional regulator [Brevibacillus laterosporus]
MYKTKEIATLVGVHPNTVRIYEEWCFISPVPRQANGYRIYSDIHLFQLMVARTLFRCEIVQGDIRKRARAIVYTCGQENFAKAEELTIDYLTNLEREYVHALSATKVVEKWLREDPTVSTRTYSRTEVALLLDITSEAVRNWERNGLITVPRLDNGYRAYGERELEQLRVIRSLRSAHYSINAILRLLKQIQQPSPDIFAILNTPTDEEDIVSVTDQLGKSLLDAIAGAKDTLALFHEKTTFQ